MSSRATLHRLVDSLPEAEVPVAARVLIGLSTAIPDALERSLLLALPDDEPDHDDDDGGLTEARTQRALGEGVTTDELKRALGL